MEFEFYILDLIQNLRCDFLDWFLVFVTKLGNSGAIWIFSGAVMLCFKKTRKAGFITLTALLIGFIVCNITLKPLVARTRPFDIREVSLIIPKPSDYSFPSGHTCSSFAAATAMLFCFRKNAVFAVLLAGLIAFSRMYLYVHFPTDILIGLILGVISAWVSYKLLNKISNL